MMSAPAIKVPSELPRFAITMMRNTLKKRFLKKPLKLKISSGILFISCTVGFLNVASTSPVSHPHATSGFNDVKGGDNLSQDAGGAPRPDGKKAGEEAVP